MTRFGAIGAIGATRAKKISRFESIGTPNVSQEIDVYVYLYED